MVTLRLAIGASVLSCVLHSCFVYDDAALRHITPRPSSASTRSIDTIDAADAREVLDAGVSRSNKNVPAVDAAALPERAVASHRVVDAGKRANPEVSETKKNTPVDSGARMPLDAGEADAAGNALDSGTRTTDASTDANTESGYCSACDNTTPSPPVLSEAGGKGNVTTLGSVTSPAPSEGGACNYGSTAIRYFAAINAGAEGQWQGGRICGQCAAVRVKTEQGWKEAVVRIVDRCSDPNCGIALGGAPAKDLMGERPGRYDGDWRFVSCAEHPEVSDAAPAIRVKEGSSRYWALVHVRNPAQAVGAIDWQSLDGASSGSFAYATEAENYFSVPEAVHMHEKIRLTIHYRDKTSTLLELAPSQLTEASAQITLP